jgi:hypothetical protein
MKILNRQTGKKKNKIHAAITLHINWKVGLFIWDHQYVIIFIKKNSP